MQLRGVVPIAVPAAAALGLGAWRLDRPSMFGSEADTYWAARLGLGRLFHLLSNIDAVHGTYYVLMHFWFDLGSGPTWMRVPSVLAAVGAVAMTSVLGTRLSGSRRIGFLAATTVALLPSINSWAQSGRPYTIITFAVTVLLWTFLRAVERPEARWSWPAFGAASVVCGYLHEMTLLLVPALGVVLAWSAVPRATVRRWAVTSGIAVLAVSPLLVISARESAAVAHLRRPDLTTLQRTVEQFLGPNAVLALVLAALAVLGAVARRPRRGAGSPDAGRSDAGRVTLVGLSVPMVLVPPTLLFAESVVGTPLFDPRYVLYGAIGTSLLAATGTVTLADAVTRRVTTRAGGLLPRAIAVVPVAAVCVALVLVPWSAQRALRTPAGHGQDFAAGADYLSDHARPGDAVVFTSDTARSAELGYPRDFHSLADIVRAQPADRAGTFLGTVRPQADIRAALVRRDHVWTLGAFPLKSSIRGIGPKPWFLHCFRPAVVARFTGVTAVLWIRRPGHLTSSA